VHRGLPVDDAAAQRRSHQDRPARRRVWPVCTKLEKLRAIYIPGPDDEAFRDLVRARVDAVASQTRARHRLKALLLRHGYRYAGQAGWTFRYRQWLSNVKFPTAAQQIAFQEYLDSIGEAQLRVERLTEEIRKLLPEWKRAPVVAALQALRGYL
jgi:transposase